MSELKPCPKEWTSGRPEDYDYYPVCGEPQNGFYPVQKGNGTYRWNGKKIVLKEAKS